MRELGLFAIAGALLLVALAIANLSTTIEKSPAPDTADTARDVEFQRAMDICIKLGEKQYGPDGAHVLCYDQLR